MNKLSLKAPYTPQIFPLSTATSSYHGWPCAISLVSNSNPLSEHKRNQWTAAIRECGEEDNKVPNSGPVEG